MPGPQEETMEVILDQAVMRKFQRDQGTDKMFNITTCLLGSVTLSPPLLAGSRFGVLGPPPHSSLAQIASELLEPSQGQLH
jgi:hypothetical protein